MEEKDYRGKKVKFVQIDPTIMQVDTDEEELEVRDHIGQIGEASSIYADGRPSHDEGYQVVFSDGFETTLVAEELELV